MAIVFWWASDTTGAEVERVLSVAEGGDMVGTVGRWVYIDEGGVVGMEMDGLNGTG
jgi:hypothetical protein